ncbi:MULTISPECIES: transglycosylase domain-containing protein [unclassified Microbacterium]|uniref:transglycosylase domain-containing protein n=1 Tax=unclassified Microbacterium TaxID=2609290 RepID=UPI001E091D3B|nr:MULTISPECIES: transglycosylase domain-containing protein [unclassified Microbacterium]CAH0194391.1 Penicillin-binding protein 4 [Microbacterium sp. Bi121]HWK78294.1 transglycosylase domain-containing protein [Microbacterium sp.]
MPQKNRTASGVLGGLLGLVGLSVVAGLLVTATVTPALAVAGAAGSSALDLFEKLPSYLKPDEPMEPSTIYGVGEDGKPLKLATFFDQNRQQVEFDEISPVMYDAILSSEDKSFYEHGGINLGATVKALVDNVRGTSSRGASTISQQYVKNVLVQQCEQNVLPGTEGYDDKIAQCWLDATNATGADGVERKLQEMRYAIQIEKDYSKNDILLGYLNIASFGGTVYGIEAAANYYFNTSAAKLTVAQAATLAGIVQNPNTFRIDKKDGTLTNDAGEGVNGEADGWALTKDRRHYVLVRMLADGKITQAQYDEADASDIVPDIKAPTQGCGAAGNNAYFCKYVQTLILDDESFGSNLAERTRALQRDGLQIYTSLDMRIQNPAVTALKDRVPANFDNKHFGAAGVTVEPGTGRILAMTQNTTFRETKTDDQAYSSLVYASDKKHGGSGGFPVGSSYKLFTLIDWLEKGHSVNESLNGNNQRLNMTDSCTGMGGPFDTKTVGNFRDAPGYQGSPMVFTRNSLNSGYFAMASKLDLCDINKVADRMGVNVADGTKTYDSNGSFESVLGSKFISPLDMAGAYATVANKGVYCEPRAIDKVVNQKGEELPVPAADCSQVITPEVAATAAYALQGVMASGGTGSQANPWDGTPLIGKTGSHNKITTMMIESSTKATTAVFVGRTEGSENMWGYMYNGNLLENIRYLVARDMQRAANQVLGGGDPFPQPDKNLTRQVLVNLPSVVGMSVDEATTTLRNAGFSVTVGPAVDSDLAKDMVAEQSPGAGRVTSGTTVTISPSSGKPKTAEVPNVVGSKFAQAKNAIEKAGFTVDSNGCSEGDDVAAQNPGKGQAAPGTTVMLLCAGGDD